MEDTRNHLTIRKNPGYKSLTFTTRVICMVKIPKFGASLVVQWLRIHLPMQETWVRALVLEDPTCRRATKPVCHNY